MSNSAYIKQLIEFIDSEFMRYVYETRDAIIEKVERKKSAGKRNGNGKISIGYYGIDVEFAINKAVALDLARKAFDINNLQSLTKLLSKRYKLFYFENDNQFTFKLFGSLAYGKTKTCRLFIKTLREVLLPHGITLASFRVNHCVADAKIKYRCNLSQYKAPIKSSDLQKQIRAKLQDQLDYYNLQNLESDTFKNSSENPITCHSYFLAENLERNILLEYTIYTKPPFENTPLVAVLGFNLGKIIDMEKAKNFEQERNSHIDKTKEFSLVIGKDNYLTVKKIITYDDVDELMEKLEDTLIEGIKLLKTEDSVSYAAITEKTFG